MPGTTSNAEVSRRLDEIADFVKRLPDMLDEKFLRKEVFEQARENMRLQVAGISVDIGDLKNDAKAARQAEERNRQWRWATCIAGLGVVSTVIYTVASIH